MGDGAQSGPEAGVAVMRKRKASTERTLGLLADAQRKAVVAAEEAGGAFLNGQPGNPRPNPSNAALHLGNARALLQIIALALSEKDIDLDEAELAEGMWGVRELVGRGMELLSMDVRR
jgi:hypothetical protein